MFKSMPDFYRKTTLLTLGLLLLTSLPVTAATGLTQRDWMITLVDALGLSFGLPDEPQDPDYINILLGSRSFRFEAEEVYSPDEDEVSVMAFVSFGPFSGSGWLQALNRPTDLHLRFTLPLPGSYQLTASVRRGDHHFAAGDQKLTGGGEERFTHISLGEIDLSSGPQEIVVTLAPSGALDYIELTAPTLTPIVPRQGWEPDQPLTWETLQTTLLQALDIAVLLPLQAPPEIFEAEQLKLPKDSPAAVVSIGHLGKPRSGKWVRNRTGTAELPFSFDANQGGFYSTGIRGMGQKLQVTINDHYSREIAGNPYFENHHLGPLFLYEGQNRVSLILPPGGGLDWLSLAPLDSSAATVSRLLGSLVSAAPPEQNDLDYLNRVLTAFGSPR